MIIVSSGNKYIDIDAYASGIAYVKLLNSLGYNAMFVSSAKANMSVCKIIKDLEFEVIDSYKPQKDDKFILVDLSNPDFFDKLVNQNNIIEIIDHHTGFEKYWLNKNIKHTIEFIGSVATIIYEKIVKHNKLEILDTKLCKLLIAAILDNTLNLKSDITTQRDIEAYKSLQKIGGLTKSFDKEYFECCQKQINSNIIEAIKNDIKIEYISKYIPKIFGQLTVYDIDVILKQKAEIENFFNSTNDAWLLNLICIKDGKSYILTSDAQSQKNISILLGKDFVDNILILPKFKLRKEIMKMARNKPEKN